MTLKSIPNFANLYVENYPLPCYSLLRYPVTMLPITLLPCYAVTRYRECCDTECSQTTTPATTNLDVIENPLEGADQTNDQDKQITENLYS